MTPDERLAAEERARVLIDRELTAAGWAVQDARALLPGIDEVVAELRDRYGPLPEPVERLMDVARLRVLARSAGVAEIVLAGTYVRFGGVDLPESRRLRLLRLYPGTQIKPVTRTVLVPRPKPATMGAAPVIDAPLVAWAAEVIRAVILEPIGGS